MLGVSHGLRPTYLRDSPGGRALSLAAGGGRRRRHGRAGGRADIHRPTLVPGHRIVRHDGRRRRAATGAVRSGRPAGLVEHRLPVGARWVPGSVAVPRPLRSAAPEQPVAGTLAELRATEDSQRLFYERNRQWQDSPGLIIEERRLRRQAETASGLYLAMRREFETARLDEINNTPVITTVDRAVAPRKPEWLQRTLITVSAAVLGVALGAMWAAAADLLARWATRNPAEADTLRRTVGRVTAELRAALRPRRRTR